MPPRRAGRLQLVLYLLLTTLVRLDQLLLLEVA